MDDDAIALMYVKENHTMTTNYVICNKIERLIETLNL